MIYSPDGTFLRARHILWTSLASLWGRTSNRTTLLYSLLSGFSLKYNLSASPEMHVSVEDGLKAMCGLTESEVLVVRTCIQLLLDGFRLTKSLT